MQVKIIIGTISFMLTMIILGFAALREPARLEAFALAQQGREIENGARIFFANCATCHGIDGKAEQCFDAASGEPIACQGLPLNSYFLLCGDRPERLELLNWQGTKQTFVESTIAAGRPGTAMPTWSEQFGGPMRGDQVHDVASFVLNWESEELCATPPITYEWAESVEDELAKHEPGDAARGEELYASYGCVACHGQLDNPDSATVGPWLGDIAENGGERIPDTSAIQYVYESILHPNDFIAPDCPTGPCPGPPSPMRQDYAVVMGGEEQAQDMADLLAYLLGQ
jgi:mono/diheme cytochrome c family protein